jgi:prepilin-type N-terminal cleavage/methylation domain-containing protein
MIHRHTQPRQRGDTIVEVLISMLIISIVLAGAYVTVHKSTIGVRNSQEHSEALKLAQSQVEQVRHDASKKAAAQVFGNAADLPFCIANETIKTAATATQCKQDAAGQPTSTEPIYSVSNSRTSCGPALPPNCYQFTTTVNWASVTGNGLANEQIVYRLYQ